mgnify:CR=1 FL=1
MIERPSVSPVTTRSTPRFSPRLNETDETSNDSDADSFVRRMAKADQSYVIYDEEEDDDDAYNESDVVDNTHSHTHADLSQSAAEDSVSSAVVEMEALVPTIHSPPAHNHMDNPALHALTPLEVPLPMDRTDNETDDTSTVASTAATTEHRTRTRRRRSPRSQQARPTHNRQPPIMEEEKTGPEPSTFPQEIMEAYQAVVQQATAGQIQTKRLQADLQRLLQKLRQLHRKNGALRTALLKARKDKKLFRERVKKWKAHTLGKFRTRLRDLHQDNASLSAKAAVLEAENNEMAEATDLARHELARMRKHIEQGGGRENQLKEKLKSAEQEASLLQDHIGQLEERFDKETKLQADAIVAQEEHKRRVLRRKFAALKTKMRVTMEEKIKDAIAQLGGQRDTLRKQVEEMQKQLAIQKDNHEVKVLALQKQLNTAVDQAKLETNAMHKNAVDSLQREIHSLHGQLEESRQSEQTTRAEANRRLEVITKLRSATDENPNSSSAARVDTLSAELSLAADRGQQLETERDDARRERDSYRTKLEDMTRQVQDLKRSQAQLQDQRDGAAAAGLAAQREAERLRADLRQMILSGQIPDPSSTETEEQLESSEDLRVKLDEKEQQLSEQRVECQQLQQCLSAATTEVERLRKEMKQNTLVQVRGVCCLLLSVVAEVRRHVTNCLVILYGFVTSSSFTVNRDPRCLLCSLKMTRRCASCVIG